jgi:hypothetical protein
VCDEGLFNAPRASIRNRWAHQGLISTVWEVIALPSRDTRTLHSPVIRRCEIQAPATGNVRVIFNELCDASLTKKELWLA